MASTKFAVQPSVYESVSRMNRQRRAVGRTESSGNAYSAYRASLDASAARALQAKQIEINQSRTELMKEAYEDQAAAATISGVASLASTGAYIYDTIAPHVESKALTNTPAVTTSFPTKISGSSSALAVSRTDLARMAAENTARTGGQVGGADIAGLAKAEAAMGGGAQAAITSAPEFTSSIAGMDVPVSIGAETGTTAAVGGAQATAVGGAQAATSALTPLTGGIGALAIEAVKDPVADWAKDAFGGEADDIVGMGARVGQGALIGAGFGGGFGAAVGAVVGGVVGIGEEIMDGSHICTAVHKEFGLPEDMIAAMGELKKYADKHHKEEIAYYMEHCPEVLGSMTDDEKILFFADFREHAAPAITSLVEDDMMEPAYQFYRFTTESIFLKYMPGYEKDQFKEII